MWSSGVGGMVALLAALLVLLPPAELLPRNGTAEVEKATDGAKGDVVRCPPGFHLQRYMDNDFSYCYYASSERRDWESARRRCGELTSTTNRCFIDLASIPDQGAMDFINAYTNQNSWIGLNDRIREGRMKWCDAFHGSYRNFAVNEPSGGHHRNCVAVQKSDVKWYARPCSESKAFVCMAYCFR